MLRKNFLSRKNARRQSALDRLLKATYIRPDYADRREDLIEKLRSLLGLAQ